MSIPDDAMFESNLNFFKEHFPALYLEMQDYEPQAELVLEDKNGPDIIFQGTAFYKQSAHNHAKKQLEKFAKDPSRIFMGTVTKDTIDIDARPVLENMLERASEAGITFGEQQTTLTSYHVVSLGFGLGQHIDGLLDITRCRNLIIVEPNFEFLYQSLFLFDWQKFGASCRKENRWFHLLTDRSPVSNLNNIRLIYRQYGPSSFDGMVVYEHYTNPTFEPLKKFFTNDADMMFSGLGYFDDELNMIGNTHGVLSSGEELVMDWSTVNPGLPVFIIGSGPSLDEAADFLVKNQDRAIIVSCGTALAACLRMGVKPDFQIEMERGQAQIDLPSELQDEGFDLDDIWLIGSTTLLPGVKDVYKKRAFFFRQMLSSYPVFSGAPNQCVRYPSPSVTNSGLSFAQDVGFREFYFFGVDLGFKDPDCHHSAGTSYTFVWTELHDRTFQGNFGGTILSNHFLSWIRDGFEGAIKGHSTGIKYYNCSDGAEITHVIPKLHACVNLPKPEKTKAQVMEELTSIFEPYTKADFDKMWRDGAVADDVQVLVSALVQAVDDNPNMFDKKFVQEIMIILDPMACVNGAKMLVQGTIMQAVMAVEYYLDRLENTEQQEVLALIAREELTVCFKRLARIAKDELAILTKTGRLGERYDPAVIEIVE